MLAKTALIFAVMYGQPTVLEYGGNPNAPYDPTFAAEITFKEARQRMDRGNPPILFALIGGPVKRASESQAIALLDRWENQNEARRQGKSAGKYAVPNPSTYKSPAKRP